MNDTLAPFSNPKSWDVIQRRPMDLPIKAGLELHIDLAERHDHPSVSACPCPLATALRIGLRRIV